MKRILAFALAVMMLVSLCACGADKKDENADKGGVTTTVAGETTTTTVEDATTTVAGDSTTTATEGAATTTEGVEAPTTGVVSDPTKAPTTTEKPEETTTKAPTTTTAAPDNRPTIKILSIGHSFSKDAMDTYMSALFKAAGYNATFGYLFYPGCSLERQYHYVKENSTSYQQYNKCVDGTWIERGGSNANTALYDEDWDIVTFQPSPDYGKGTIAYKCEWGCNRNIENDYVHFSDLVGIVRQRLHANGNKDVKFYYHLTWAFAADCKLWSFTYSGFNQMTMFWDFWKATLKHVTPLSEIQGVIPCITSVQNARTSWMGDTFNAPSFDDNGKPSDGYHLNDKGDLVAAMTWVCYFTGKKAADLKIKTPYSDAEYAAIAEAVDNAIAKPQAVTQSSYTTAP